MAGLRPRRLAIWLAAAAAAVVLLAVGGAFVYIHFISGPAPAPLGLKAGASPSATTPLTQTEPAASSGSLAGSWRVAAGSVVGYRVNEVLAGQQNVAVGRTSQISGSVTIAGGAVTAAQFTVQMATIQSDESQRDAQFNGRIMDTSAFPTGTLKLTGPIALAPLAATGVIKSYHAAADLTLHGQTRPVTFALQAERTGAGIEVSGSIPVVFANWGISNPSFPPFVTTQNHGELEFLLKLASG